MKITDKITITNEDNMQLMKRYPDNYFDLALIDPTYGISVNMNAGRKKDTKSKKRTIKKWDNETPTAEYFNELFRVSKNQVIWGGNAYPAFDVKPYVGFDANSLMSATPPASVFVETLPNTKAPANSKIAAIPTACAIVSVLEPTDVAKAFATSLLPVPKP